MLTEIDNEYIGTPTQVHWSESCEPLSNSIWEFSDKSHFLGGSMKTFG